MALNVFILAFYRIFRKLIHKIGLNRFWGVRKFANFLKGIYEQVTLPFPVTIQGMKFAKAPPDIWLSGIHEPNATYLCKRIVKKGWTVVDMGADYGYYSLLFAKLIGPNGKVFAFEPNGKRFNYVVENIAINDFTNIVLLKKAVSDRSGIEDFFLQKETASFYSSHPERKAKGVEKIESVSLDNFLKDYSKPVDFIKMDIEGAEIKALAGMEKTLEKNRELKLVIEIHLRILNRIKIPYQNVLSQLRNYGFQLYWINNDGTCDKISDEEIMSRAKNKTNIIIFCSK